MIVKYDSLDRFEKPKLTLCNPGAKYENGLLTRVLGTLSDYDSEEIVFNFNSTSDLNFRLYSVEHDDPDQNAHAKFLYDAVQNKRLIYVENIGFFVISDMHKGYDGLTNYKDVTAKSADSEIEQKKLPYIADGTYPFYTLVDRTEDQGLLNTLVSILPLWSIGEIDDNVALRWRTFEDVSVDENILSFMLQEMQNAYECIFVFDIMNRVINVYDQNNYVRLTDIHLTKDDLIDTLGVDSSAGDVYTAITVLGGDNITIGAINPTGTNTIYDFSYYVDWMTDGLGEKVLAWQQLVNSKQTEYYNLNLRYYELLSTCANYSQDVQRLNTQMTIYHRLRDNIVAGSSERAMAEYNTVIVENGGTAITISDSIQSMISQIDALLVDCRTQMAAINAELDDSNEELDELEASIQAIVNSVSITNYFTEEEYNELYFYIFEGSYNDEYVVITDIMTPSEQFDQMKIMYDRAVSQLARVSKPTQQYTVDVENFIYSSNFEHWSSQLETGCLVNVELDKGDVAPLFLTNITINYDDHSLSMTFGNRFNKYDPKTLFENVLGGINKSTNSINFLKETIYPIKSGQFNAMREQIQASRDLTMDAALASENEEVTIDGAGYTSKEMLSDGTYDPRQVKLTGKSLVFTDDAWESCKVAIGQIILGDGTVTYGVNAETIIGDLIIGNQLVIKDNEGNDLFTVIDGRISSQVSDINSRMNKMIVDESYTYCIRPYGTSPAAYDTDWSAAFPPSWRPGERVWRKTVATYEGGQKTIKAIEDITGANGDDGISVVSVVTQYVLSGSDERITPVIYPSDSTMPGSDVYPSISEWSDTVPDFVPGHYYWARLVTTYSDGNVVYGEPFLYSVLSDLWEITTKNTTSITQTNERITMIAESIERTNESVDRRFSQIEQRADGIEATVSQHTEDINGVNNSISNLDMKADNINLSIRSDLEQDYVTKSSLGYDSEHQVISQGSILDMASDAITATIWSQGTGADLYQTVMSLQEDGLSVTTGQDESTSTIDGTGITVWKQVDGEKLIVAEFTRDIAYTNNLQIATYAFIAAHRFEVIEGKEWDYDENGTDEEKAAKITEGTGLAWIGRQEQLIVVEDSDEG